MRARLLVLIAIAISAGVVTAPAASAATRYQVDATTLSVRNGPAGHQASGYTLGHLFGGSGAGPNVGGVEHFDLVRRSANGAWGYGRAHGHFGAWGGARCGWVLLSGLRNTGRSVSANCPNPQGDSPSDDQLAGSHLFAPGTWVYGTGEGTVQDAVIVPCAYPYVYANYDPSTQTFSNRYPNPLPAGRGTTGAGHPQVTSGYTGFGTRYQTADGRAWLIKDTQSPAGGPYAVPNWHFVRSECIRRL